MRKALSYLQSGALDRAEKHMDLATWLIAVQDQQGDTKNAELRRNLLWRAVAAAPPGWTHVRSGMIGALLEDVQAGLSFEDVKRKHNAKMDPLAYQRPKAAPAEGNIAQAEKVIVQMQSAGSFARRFAKLEDLETLWRQPPPSAPKESAAGKGVFDHLRKAKPPAGPVVSDAAPKKMTWVKFRDTVLPQAEKIEVLIASGTLPFAAFTTTIDPDSPVLFQWGHHVAWYFYAGHSSAFEWNLEPNKHVEVSALSMTPTAWGGKELEHQGIGVMFCLRGAKDLRNSDGATGIFPESLRSEYHGIRKTVEAHNKTLKPEGRDEAEACGLLLMKGAAWGRHIIRVTAGGIQANYHLDRWD